MSPPIRPPLEAYRPGAEEVLVVPRVDLLSAGLLPEGFLDGGWERCLALVARRGKFVRRDLAEDDPSLKQIIPYAVVTFRDLVFLLRRTARGGEARLHGKLSIGVGGHINPEGVPPEELVEAGLRRELEEELSFDRPYRATPLGLINDEDLPVGRVHLGLVYRVLAGDGGVRVREDQLLTGSFTPLTELPPLLGSMESWSRLVAEALFFPRRPADAAGPAEAAGETGPAGQAES